MQNGKRVQTAAPWKRRMENAYPAGTGGEFDHYEPAAARRREKTLKHLNETIVSSRMERRDPGVGDISIQPYQAPVPPGNPSPCCDTS